MILGISKTLPGQRIATKKAPPAFLQVQPAGPSRNEDVMDARMLFEPSPLCCSTLPPLKKG